MHTGSPPRDLAQAPQLSEALRSARIGVIATVVGCTVLAVPLSFFIDAPWSPIYPLAMGVAMSAVIAPIFGVMLWIASRYANLYRTGRVVTGTVIEPRGHGCVVQIDVAGPNLAVLGTRALPVGTPVSALVGDAGNSLVLVVIGTTMLEQASLLTRSALPQVLVG